MIKLGDTVEYITSYHDEVDTKYKVTEINHAQGWCAFEAIVPMKLRPTYASNIKDMRLCAS